MKINHSAPLEEAGFLCLFMSTSLYQKYRPQHFSELVGQAHVRTTLLNELSSGAVSHSYLFSGPRGVGKTTSARLLARAVNCENLKEGEPDNTCTSCMLILSGKALDIVEIDAASHTGVDHVRENIIENARVVPSQLKWKVFIIDEVHMLSTSAFNALLKTLEEPPSKTLFILATTEIHKIPATIISRCERFQFRKIGYEDMLQRLRRLAQKENIIVEDSVFEVIAQRSEGALRDAESVLGQVLTLDATKVTADMVQIIIPYSDTTELLALWEEIVRKQASQAFSRINRLKDEGVVLVEFTREMVEFLRKVLLYRVQDSLEPLQYLHLNKDHVQRIGQLAADLSPTDISEMIDAFLRAFEQSKDAIIPQLPLELAVVKLTGALNASAPQPAIGIPQNPRSGEPQVLQSKENPMTESQGQKAPQESASTISVDKVEKSVSITEQPIQVTASEAAPLEEGTVSPTDDGSLSMEVVKKQWDDLLLAMQELNHALHLTMKVAQLVSVVGNTVTIGFEYQFYQDRLNDAHNRPVLDEAFEKVYGVPVILETVIGPEYTITIGSGGSQNIVQPSDDEVANVWDLAASSFGGDGGGGEVPAA